MIHTESNAAPATEPLVNRIEILRAIGQIDNLTNFLDEMRALTTLAVESYELRNLKAYKPEGPEWGSMAHPLFRRLAELNGYVIEDLHTIRDLMYEASKVG